MSGLVVQYTESGHLYSKNMPSPTSKSWVSFCATLAHETLQGADTDRLKRSTPTFCPGLFQPGTQRVKENVTGLQLVVFDVDHGAAEGPVLGMLERLTNSGLAYAVYTTYKHTPQTPAYRLIVPLPEVLPPEEFLIARSACFDEIQPPALKRYGDDVSRCFFYPATHASRIQYSGLALCTDGKPYVAPKGYVPGLAPQRDAVHSGPPEEEAGVNLGALRKTLRGLHRKMKLEHPCYLPLGAMLDGAPIAQRGERDTKIQQLVGYLVFVLPDTTAVSTYLELMMASLQAMGPYDELFAQVVEKVKDKVRRAYRDKCASRAERAERERLMLAFTRAPLPRKGESRAKMLAELRGGTEGAAYDKA